MAFCQWANTGSLLVVFRFTQLLFKKCQSSIPSEKTLDHRMYSQLARGHITSPLPVHHFIHTTSLPAGKIIYFLIKKPRWGICVTLANFLCLVFTGFNKVTYLKALGPHLDPIRQQANMARKCCNHRPNHGTVNIIIALSWVSENYLSWTC